MLKLRWAKKQSRFEKGKPQVVSLSCFMQQIIQPEFAAP